MKKLFVILFVVAGLNLFAQSLSLIDVRGPESVEVDELWPMTVNWEKGTIHGEVQLKIDAPDWFTLLSAPSQLNKQLGTTTAWMSVAHFTPPGSYLIHVELVRPSVLQPPLKAVWEVQVNSKPQITCALLDQGVDSTRYWIYNSGNEIVEHQKQLIYPGKGYQLSVRTAKNSLLNIKAKAGEWDTIVELALRSYVDWESTANGDTVDGVKVSGYASQNLIGWKAIRPQLGLAVTGNNWSFKGDHVVSNTLGSITYQHKNMGLSTGYGWGKALPFGVSELTPFADFQVELAQVQMRARWSTAYQKVSCGYERQRDNASQSGISITLFNQPINSGISGRLFYLTKPMSFRASFQPGLAEGDIRVRIPHVTLIARGAKTTLQTEEIAPFRSHFSNTALFDLGPLHFFHQFTRFDQSNGIWGQQSSSWAAYRWRGYELKAVRFSYASNSRGPDWQISTMLRHRSFRLGGQALRSEEGWKATPFCEYSRQKISLRGAVLLDDTGSLNALQGQLRCKLGQGYHLFSTIEQRLSTWSYSTRIYKVFPKGQCAIILRSDASGTLSWQGSLQSRNRGKTLEGRCVDENGQPISGIELMLNEQLVRTDALGRFRWKHLEKKRVAFQIQAASLPFGVFYDGPGVKSVDLIERTTKIELTFRHMRAVSGQFSHRSGALFFAPIDFSLHKIRLQFTTGEVINHPIYPDGTFHIGDLPSGEAVVSLVPPLKGYELENTVLKIEQSVDQSEWTFFIKPTQESIPFEQL